MSFNSVSFKSESFESISNGELLNRLKVKVENERKLLMEILYALKEVETRKLHLEIGYSDLYTFAMKELGYSAGAAHRRISAMRLIKTLPDVAPKLESGELGLENASQAQVFFRKEDQRRKAEGEQKLSLEEKCEVVTELFGKSTREGQRVLMERSPDVMIPTEKTRPLPEQKTLIQFVASQELMAKLEELKNFMAHKNFEGRMDVLVEQMADIALNELRSKPQSKTEARSARKTERGQSGLKEQADTKEQADKAKHRQNLALDVREPSGLPAPGVEKRSRYIPASEKRKVLLREQNGCTFRDSKSGRICGSRHGLQFEHIVPFSQGGSNQAENLTLFCGAHNRYQAERMGLGRV